MCTNYLRHGHENSLSYQTGRQIEKNAITNLPNGLLLDHVYPARTCLRTIDIIPSKAS